MNLPAAQGPHTTGTAVATRIMTAQETQQYATDLARSSLLSSYFQNNPANVMYAMELGRSYGMEPVAVLANIHVFDDGQGRAKAALSADFMVSLARREGHVVHVEYDARSEKATGTLIRRELLEMDPTRLKLLQELGVDLAKAYTFREVWTREKASEAGLLNKSNWKKYFGDMLKARVKAAVVRAGASEALIQLSNAAALAGSLVINGQAVAVTTTHTADELGAEMTDEGEKVTITRADEQRMTARPASTSVPRQPGTPAEQAGVDSVETKLQTFVENNTAEDLATFARTIAADGTSARELKITKLRQLHAACKRLGRLEAPVHSEDGSPATLNSILMGCVQPLLNAV
jgi:hypothetical protein